MKLAISNLAWTKKENLKILNLLKKSQINHLEYSYNILESFTQKKNIKEFYNKKGIKLYSMQSILFNLDNCFVFGSKNQNLNFLKEIKKKISLAKKLKSKIIVFGSPKNRLNFGLKRNDRDKIFLSTMIKIAKFCELKKITFCLEANPTIYNCDYITHTHQALKLVKKINNKFFKINLDTSTLIFNKENYTRILSKNLSYVGHIQLSVPKLKSIMLKKQYLKKFLLELKNSNYQNVVSIEQLKSKYNIGEIKKIIKYFKVYF